jgi:uncharacterized protein YndB with AHSA1/START domain
MTETSSTDYEKTVGVAAHPGALFDALTTTDGLTAWWTTAEGDGDTGGMLRFLFDAGPCVMHVDRAAQPVVQWTVTECDFLPDWVGTRPTFTIADAGDDGSELRFRHHGLTSDLECIDECSRGWDHFIESLRAYAESGAGMPRGSAEDNARR